MSIAGEAGVRHVMKSLLADFDILMNCAGVNSISEITKDHLSRFCVADRRKADLTGVMQPGPQRLT